MAEQAKAKGNNNIAFACRLLLGQKTECVDVLLDTERAPEAAFFSRTYAPSLVSKSVEQWREGLGSKGKKLAGTIANPEEHPEAFEEGWEAALERERVGATQQPAIASNGLNGSVVPEKQAVDAAEDDSPQSREASSDEGVDTEA